MAAPETLAEALQRVQRLVRCPPMLCLCLGTGDQGFSLSPWSRTAVVPRVQSEAPAAVSGFQLMLQGWAA